MFFLVFWGFGCLFEVFFSGAGRRQAPLPMWKSQPTVSPRSRNYEGNPGVGFCPFNNAFCEVIFMVLSRQF